MKSYLNDPLIRSQFPNVSKDLKTGMIKRSLYNPVNWSRFMKWWQSHIVRIEGFDETGALDEVDRTMSYSEAVNHITSLHPEWFRANDPKDKVKQIVFVKRLIPLLISGSVKCTYRNRRLFGNYYVVTDRFRRKEGLLVVEVTGNELVRINKLKDADARLAGIDSAVELKKLLKKWYTAHEVLFRNWLKVKQVC